MAHSAEYAAGLSGDFQLRTMVEAPLKDMLGIPFTSIRDYIALDYKLTKLHGSVNWGRDIFSRTLTDFQNQNDYQIANEIIEKVSADEITHNYRVVTPPLTVKDSSGLTAFFPAIAIPTQADKEFECPKDHVETLEKCIAKVTKLLVIGWRATEKPFLDLLGQLLPKGLSVMVVSGSHQGAIEVRDRLTKALGVGPLDSHDRGSTRVIMGGGRFGLYDAGFTQLVVNREASRFLGD